MIAPPADAGGAPGQNAPTPDARLVSISVDLFVTTRRPTPTRIGLFVTSRRPATTGR
jgi:hypothetical protein